MTPTLQWNTRHQEKPTKKACKLFIANNKNHGKIVPLHVIFHYERHIVQDTGVLYNLAFGNEQIIPVNNWETWLNWFQQNGQNVEIQAACGLLPSNEVRMLLISNKSLWLPVKSVSTTIHPLQSFWNSQQTNVCGDAPSGFILQRWTITPSSRAQLLSTIQHRGQGTLYKPDENRKAHSGKPNLGQLTHFKVVFPAFKDCLMHHSLVLLRRCHKIYPERFVVEGKFMPNAVFLFPFRP